MGSTAGTTYKAKIEGKLITAITTSTTTGITYKIKQVNGVTPTHPTAAHRLHIEQKTALISKHEIFDVAAGTTQSGQDVTLGTVTRALPLSDGTDFTGSGTAQSFGAGADIFLTWDEHDAAMTMKTDLVNTIIGSGAIRGSSTTVALIRPNSVTETQRDAISAANGDIVYNSTTGRINSYEGGAWGAAGSTTVADMSTTVAGKPEEATVAEQAAHTATGGTGARLVPAVANLVTLAADPTWISGAIPTLNTSKYIDISLLASGTPTGTKFIRDDGTLQTPTIAVPTTLIGGMMIWPTDTAPALWLLCYGQAVSRTTYSALFGVIGTSFGSGDGSTTFNLPDTRGRFALGQDDMGGSSANRVTDSSADTIGQSGGTSDGAHTHSTTTSTATNSGGSEQFVKTLLSTSVLPPYFTINFIIFANA